MKFTCTDVNPHLPVISPRRLFRSLFCIGVPGLLLLSQGAGATSFQPGEILVDEFNTSNILLYSSTGTLLQTFTGTGTNWDGLGLTPDGNLVTTYRLPSYGLNILNPAGTQIASFTTLNDNVNDVSVFANGTLALNLQNTQFVALYSQSGTLLGTTTLTGVQAVVGSTVGTDNILYVADGTGDKIAKMDQSGNFLGTFNVGFAPGDLVMSPVDGTLWVSGWNDDNIYHLTATGTLLGSFSTGLSGHMYGIGIAPDGNSLYATTTTATVVRHLSLTGTDLGDFTIPGNQPSALLVVPAPEPGSATLLAAGLSALLGCRHRRGKGAASCPPE